MNKNGKYNGLDDLLSHNSKARDFYMSLPDWVQGTIWERRDNIDGEDDLYRYAETLTAGDK